MQKKSNFQIRRLLFACSNFPTACAGNQRMLRKKLVNHDKAKIVSKLMVHLREKNRKCNLYL